MTTPFAELFARSESTCVEVDGEELHSVVVLDLEGPVTFVVVRVRARQDRAQGIVLEGGDQLLQVGVVKASRITLWSDTAPETVAVSIAERGPLSLKLWNTWRDDGIEHAWVGWAAMKRRAYAGVTTLSCRDGHPDGDFDDLVVEVSQGSTHDSGMFTTALQ